MSRFKNLKIWRQRLPHWRADGEIYYATFRHKRELSEDERRIVLKLLMSPHGRKWDLMMACVLPEVTEVLFKVMDSRDGEPYELSDIIEKAKTKAGKLIIKASGERFPPFYSESYDRIVRDEVELEERWSEIFDSPVKLELVEDSEEYEYLWVSEMPDELNQSETQDDDD